MPYLFAINLKGLVFIPLSPDSANQCGLKTRKAAWEVLQAVAAGAYADAALDRTLRKYSFGKLDRGLVTEIAFGAIRKRYLLDCWIDFLGKIPACRQPPLLRWLLHVGLYQIICMERIPAAAAVNTAVEMAKMSKLKRLAPVVNGLLRSAIRSKGKGIDLPVKEKQEEMLAQCHSLPVWLAEKLLLWQGDRKAEKIAKAFNETPFIDIRVNRLRANLEMVRSELLASGIESFLIKDCPYGLQVPSGAGDLRGWPGYKEGFWSVQDRAAQCISPLLLPKRGERVLDACAAPGGKTTHLAELMEDKGEIWAVDRSHDRMKRLKDNSVRMGINSVKLLVADACDLLKEKPAWRNYFQKILVDAPCSGLGTLARNPDARWRVSLEDLEELIDLQAHLLDSLAPLLSPGGRLVYSTCTINPEENLSQVNQFLSNHSGFTLQYEKQIWPGIDNAGDGFFSAVIDR